MKILYHHKTQAKDGCIVHIEELIASFRRQGHEVVVVAPGGAGQGLTQAAQGKGFVSRLRQWLPGAIFELVEMAYGLFDFGKLLVAWRKHRPDVIYERYNAYTPGGAWLRRLSGLPMLLEVNSPIVHERSQHGGLALLGLARWNERLAWRGADRVLPVTQVLAGYLLNEGVSTDRIVVIPNGINPRDFPAVVDNASAKALLGLTGRTVLGFAGFVRPWHRLEWVVDVLAEVAPDAVLLVIGDGPARKEIESRAREMGVADRVIFTGVVSHRDALRHLAAADIALQPAATPYASPLKLFEYMQLGRAILAPDMPSMREVLVDDVNALLFAPDDMDSFKSAIVRLCRDNTLRSRLGAAANGTITSRDMTWDGNARRVIELFTMLLEAQRGAVSIGKPAEHSRPG